VKVTFSFSEKVYFTIRVPQWFSSTGLKPSRSKATLLSRLWLPCEQKRIIRLVWIQGLLFPRKKRGWMIITHYNACSDSLAQLCDVLHNITGQQVQNSYLSESGCIGLHELVVIMRKLLLACSWLVLKQMCCINYLLQGSATVVDKEFSHSAVAKRCWISPTGKKKTTLILLRGQNRAFGSATS
jgi:hypothetical protein